MAPYYHATPNNSTPNKHREPIPGGSFPIPPLALIITWAAYRIRKIDWLTFRVWLALFQIKSWHDATLRTGNSHLYNVRQIAQAIKSDNLPLYRLTQAINNLHSLNLAHFSPQSITFSQRLDDITDPELHQVATHMLNNLGNSNASRSLRMPRRILVFLMTTNRPRPVFAGTMLGLLLRCMLFKRYSAYKGCCTSTWIAAVFGGDTSSIKSARSQLIKDGWFARLPTAQRVRQTHGEWIALVLEIPPLEHRQIEPPPPPKLLEIEPPLQNQSLSHEIETNQFLQSGASPKPTWHHIQIADLSTSQRRQQLYQAALVAKAIPSTPAGELTFFSAIAHARRVATRNPCGLLRHVIETPSSQAFITQADEDQALTWLTPLPPSQNPDSPSLSLDALFVRTFRRNLKRAGYHNDPYSYLASTRHGKTDWPPDRWLKATLELLKETT